jgi:hypothetical protein
LKAAARLGRWFARTLEASTVPVLDEHGEPLVEVRIWAIFPDPGIVFLPVSEDDIDTDGQQRLMRRIDEATDQRGTDDQP